MNNVEEIKREFKKLRALRALADLEMDELLEVMEMFFDALKSEQKK